MKIQTRENDHHYSSSNNKQWIQPPKENVSTAAKFSFCVRPIISARNITKIIIVTRTTIQVKLASYNYAHQTQVSKVDLDTKLTFQVTSIRDFKFFFFLGKKKWKMHITYSLGRVRLMSGDGLCSDLCSDPFQAALCEDNTLEICLLLMLSSASPWLCPCDGDAGFRQGPPSGAACEIGLAAVTASETSGAAGIVICCSRWCFLLCVLYPFGMKLPTTIW